MIDTEALRKKVIELAVQGKLTEQLPEDGDAKTLYAQIREEKARLIKEGKINKGKSFLPVLDDEIPFEIPSNWEWTRIGEVTYSHGQKTPQNTFCYIDVGTLDNIKHKLSDKENIIEAKLAPSRARKIIEQGDIIYSTVRPYLHNICIIDRNFSYEPIASTAFAIMHTFDGFLVNKFLFIWLLSHWFDKYANAGNSKGVLYPAIGEKDIFNGLLPMPPYNEQERIVAVVGKIFAQIDTIDTLQKQYASNCDVLKAKVTVAGIKGKLTEQLQSDGNADHLYEHILEEKANVIADGKIKKEKALPEVSLDEIPFEIPQNWKWIRLMDLGMFSGGKTPSMNKKEYWSEGLIPWVTSKDMKQKYITTSQMLISETAAKELTIFPAKTVLFVVRSGILRRLFPVSILLENGTINQDLKALRLFIPDMCEYVYYLLKGFEMTILRQYTKDGTTVNNIMFDSLLTMPIPLPPFPEQNRISKKLKELLSILDK